MEWITRETMNRMLSGRYVRFVCAEGACGRDRGKGLVEAGKREGNIQLDTTQPSSSGLGGQDHINFRRHAVVTAVVGGEAIIVVVGVRVRDAGRQESEGAEPHDDEEDVEAEDGPVIVCGRHAPMRDHVVNGGYQCQNRLGYAS
jgi:hypothetical protein